MNPTPFFNFINERHRIHCKRQRGDPWPWTDDPILQQYRFCNVFRELDTVTRWVDKYIRKPYARRRELPHMLLTARYINWPDTLAEIIERGKWYPRGQYDWRGTAKIMKERAARGDHVWTNAYTISTNGHRQNKADYICGHVLQAAWKRSKLLEEVAHTSLEAFCDCAQQIDGVGGFMSYEVACDLRWCPGWLNNAPDILTWANAGPGAKRGLNRLYDRPLKKAMRNDAAVLEMQHLLALAPLYLESHVPDLEMREIEHVSCEWDKYERVRLGQGTPRSLYHPLT